MIVVVRLLLQPYRASEVQPFMNYRVKQIIDTTPIKHIQVPFVEVNISVTSPQLCLPLNTAAQYIGLWHTGSRLDIWIHRLCEGKCNIDIALR
jgi:hypothetical protein